jgi:predicted nucleotidyltransferase
MTVDIQKQFILIEKIIQTLVKVYDPQAVYIFGSYAWGQPDENSDLDIAVIVKHSDLDMANRIRLSYNALWDFEIPMDIIVYTESEILEKAKYHSTLQNKILNKGQKVYEAA